jgi:rubrerythrin
MAITYSAAELLEIARQMERNGYAFYTQAADLTEGEVAGTLRELADMERVHERTFAAMAAELPAEERQAPAFDPNDEAAQYVRAVAGGHVFDLKADPVEWLARGRSFPEIIRKAIGLERDTIIYYLGVRNVMTGLAGERIDDIIHEEMNHVVVLTGELQRAEPQ